MMLAAIIVAAAAATSLPLPRGFRPAVVIAADLNGDGKADVAICGENQQLVILAGDGRGGLRAIEQGGRCGFNPTTIIAADLNGDRKIDLAVANHDTDHLTVLLNDGRGRFSSREVKVHSLPHPHTVAAADINGDSRVDLITDSWGENRLTLLLADQRGGWQSPGTPIEIGRKPYINVIAADFDGDGRIDLAMPNAGFDSVCILFGDGRGHFAHAAQSPLRAGPTPFHIGVADVNGDRRPDIIVANYSGHMTDTSRDGVTWIRNDGKRRFTAFPTRVATAHGCWRVTTGDINGDGIADVAYDDADANSVGILYGSQTGLRPGRPISTMPSPHSISLADLNGDRRADLLVITEDRDELLVVLSH